MSKTASFYSCFPGMIRLFHSTQKKPLKTLNENGQEHDSFRDPGTSFIPIPIDDPKISTREMTSDSDEINESN